MLLLTSPITYIIGGSKQKLRLFKNPEHCYLYHTHSMDILMKRGILFFAILFPSVALLYFGLSRDPRRLPSALIGKKAPPFSLRRADGGAAIVDLTALKGRPVVLNFWATWCGTCVEEHRLIQRAQAQFERSGTLFLSVLYADTEKNVMAFNRQFGTGAPVLLDPESRTAIDYGVAGVPETFFIDRDGIVRYKHSGLLTPDVLMTQLQAMQAEGGR